MQRPAIRLVHFVTQDASSIAVKQSELFFSSDEREYWEERAAIMEFEGGLTRKEAEFQVLKRREYLRKTG